MKLKIKLSESESLTFGNDFDKNLKFSYENKINEHHSYAVNEVVPKQIIQKGEKSILQYVSKKIKEARKELEKISFIEDNIRKNPIPIQTNYKDGTSLEGRIVEATSENITVKLDKPEGGQRSIHYGMASCIAKKYIFTEDYKISAEGYHSAHRALCLAYEDRLQKPQENLINKLNNFFNK